MRFNFENTETDTITNSGKIFGALNLSNAASAVINTGEISDTIFMKQGNDVLFNSGDIFGTVGTGTGIDTLTNTGDIVGQIIMGSGQDVMFNSGNLFGVVDMGLNGDILNNSGVISQNDINGTGNGENNVITGNGGDNVLRGAVGDDTVDGGRDADTFRFTKVGQSLTSNQQDRIADFEQGTDVIDLSRLSQDPLTYIGTGAFSSTGQAEVRMNDGAGNGFIRVDIDGDGAADTRIKVSGFSVFVESDFLL